MIDKIKAEADVIVCEKEQRIAELEQALAEALAQNERLRVAAYEMLINRTGIDQWYGLESAVQEAKSAALASLKAEWQAEAVQSILDECEHWSLMGTWGILVEDISEKLEGLYQRAQEAGE